MKNRLEHYITVALIIVIALCVVFINKVDNNEKIEKSIKNVCYDMSRFFPSDSGKYEECVMRNEVKKIRSEVYGNIKIIKANKTST